MLLSVTGQTISHYKIVEKLGEGGMGTVYKAEDLKLDRFVALKFLAPHLVQEEEGRRRFIREAKAAAALEHANICTVYEIDEADGRTFIAMAFIEGGSLETRIEAGPLKLKDALDIATQTGQGLQAAHEKGVVHRDIKPANLMITGAGSQQLVTIMDFGLAQLAGGSKITKPESRLGTAAYMSPEQTEGATVDHRTDIWALGVVLYEMISGQLPFKGHYDKAVLYSILNEDPEPLSALRTGVPKEMERIANKALAKNPESRYPHIDDMLVDLRELQKQTELGARDTRRAPSAPKPARRTPWYIAAGAVVIAVTVAVSAWMGVFGPSDDAPPEPLQAVPLTSYPGSEFSSSFSPDGNQVAFCWDGENQDNLDIYVKMIGSETPLRLTTDPAPDLSPAWSADGRTIAFLRRLPGGRAAALLIPAIGGPERLVAEISEPAGILGVSFSLAWGPDGKELVVVERSSPGDPFALFLLSTESGEKRRLTSPPAKSVGDFGPAFSPDGRGLAFSRRLGNSASDIYLLALAEDLTPNGEPQRLTFQNLPSWSPTWTPDGREIVYTSGWLVESSSLWRISVSRSGEPERLAVAGEGARLPAISRRANRLAYTKLSGDTNIWRLPLRESGSGAAAATRLISSTREDYNPQYSPDGKRIAFSSSRTGTYGIWLSDADGSNAAPLFVKEGAHSGTPRWSPDGRRIAFDSNPEGQQDIYVISARGGNPIRLTTHPVGDAMPSWSQDGEWMHFGSRRSGRFEVWKVSVGGGEAIQVTQDGGAVAFESTDGKFVYYTKGRFARASVWKVPVGGGEETQVLESVLAFLNFSVTPQGIYFIQAPDTDEPGGSFLIRFFDFATGRATTIHSLPPGVGADMGLTVSPDSRSILYTQLDQSQSDLMLVENFR